MIDTEFWQWQRDHDNSDGLERMVARLMLWLAKIRSKV